MFDTQLPNNNFSNAELGIINPKPKWTRISANFTANKQMRKQQILESLKKKKIGLFPNNPIKEEFESFIGNGSEGINISFQQECLIYAIAYIFTQYGYPESVECSFCQICKALKFDKRLTGGQRQSIKEDLESLSRMKFPILSKERIQHIGRWLTFEPLIGLEWGEKRDNGKIEYHLQPLKRKVSVYKIKLNKTLFSFTEISYRLANPNIGKEIRDHKKNKGERPTKYDIRLYDLLLGENREVVKRNWEKIAQGPMLMGHYLKGRKHKCAREKLISIYDMYKDLGYLLDYKLDQKGSNYPLDFFLLNPQKFYRLRKNKSNESSI